MFWDGSRWVACEDHEFQPAETSVVTKNKRAILSGLKQAGDKGRRVYLATDPDWEGDVISWHLQAATDVARICGERLAVSVLLTFC